MQSTIDRYSVVRISDLYRGDDFDTSSVTFLDRSAQSHYLAFAAEKSRLLQGQVLDMDEFTKSL